MAGVEGDGGWPLVFGGETFGIVSARALWRRMLRTAYDGAGLGLIFIDRAKALTTERAPGGASAANDDDFGHEACLLGSINLAALVEDAFTPAARIPERKLHALAAVAVRFLDNVIDVSGYATPEQEMAAKAWRRLGLGVTGLADALIMCGAHYGAEDGRRLAERWVACLCRSAYSASAALARVKGCFPFFDMDEQLTRPFVAGLDGEVSNAIGKHGLRNGALMTIAPTIATSLLADNVSGGIEPVGNFAGSEDAHASYAERRFREFCGAGALPSFFVSGRDVAPQARLEMQAAISAACRCAAWRRHQLPARHLVRGFRTALQGRLRDRRVRLRLLRIRPTGRTLPLGRVTRTLMRPSVRKARDDRKKSARP